MALDGITVSSIVKELKENLIGSRIDKIHQPEKDEIILNIRGFGVSYKLLLTANSTSPRIHFTDITKKNPLEAPIFCMVLRKHIANGKILNVKQIEFDRIIEIYIEALNEMGDMSSKKLIIEMMGKHSNIILVDQNNVILDSIKRINFQKSSVREVLPGKNYITPPNQKENPIDLDKNKWDSVLNENTELDISTFITKNYMGISFNLIDSICNEIEKSRVISTLTTKEKEQIYINFNKLLENVKNRNYINYIVYNKENNPQDFHSIELIQYKNINKKTYESVSNMLETFYKEKDLTYRINQKTYDIKKIVQNAIDRCKNKKRIYDKTLKDIENRDALKIKGELITANIYNLEKGMENFKAQNYNDENLSEIIIELDKNLTPVENAQKYYKKYNKYKRTFLALQEQIKQNEEEQFYLETVMNNINNCIDENDIEGIRNELFQSGFIKKRKNKKKQKSQPLKPLHYVSENGFNIYVGKNNIQNDELTLKFAKNTDYWFHTKDIAGSHVILKTDGKEPKEEDLIYAAKLCAYYSKAKDSSNVPVDYTYKKYVKKINGAKPGMVIYTNNKTLYVTPKKEEHIIY